MLESMTDLCPFLSFHHITLESELEFPFHLHMSACFSVVILDVWGRKLSSYGLHLRSDVPSACKIGCFMRVCLTIYLKSH